MLSVFFVEVIMLLSFFDIFKFFTEIELTDEMRKYELIGVSIVLVISLSLTVFGIIKNNRKYNGEKKDDIN